MRSYNLILHEIVVVQSFSCSCLTLCDPIDCSTPGFPVLHHLPEFAQTHIHWVGDAIQPSYTLSSPSPASNLSQHQGFFPVSRLFPSDDQSIGVSAVASVLPMNIQGWFPLGNWFDLLAVQGTLKSLLQYYNEYLIYNNPTFFVIFILALGIPRPPWLLDIVWTVLPCGRHHLAIWKFQPGFYQSWGNTAQWWKKAVKETSPLFMDFNSANWFHFKLFAL